MVKIRLSRFGAKKKPFYRIVAVEARSKRSGKPLEVIGYWNPIKKDLKIDKKKYNEWISKGAIPTDAIRSLLE